MKHTLWMDNYLTAVLSPRQHVLITSQGMEKDILAVQS